MKILAAKKAVCFFLLNIKSSLETRKDYDSIYYVIMFITENQGFFLIFTTGEDFAMNTTRNYENSRTDLAIERLDLAAEVLPSGVTREEVRKGTVKITTVTIDDPSSARILEKKMGRYITIEPTGFRSVPQNFEAEVETVAEYIASLLPEGCGSALVVGLGNSQITPDALGPKVIQNTLATRHISQKLAEEIGLSELASVCAIAPGVLGQTGIETAEIVAALCRETSPDVVIVIDALASKSIFRLGTTIQLADTGISPGSGVLNHRRELSRETLGVPVISLGVPTVVDLKTIVSDYTGAQYTASSAEFAQAETMMVTPREVDVLIEHAAKTIGFAINKALHPSLQVEDIAALVS